MSLKIPNISKIYYEITIPRVFWRWDLVFSKFISNIFRKIKIWRETSQLLLPTSPHVRERLKSVNPEFNADVFHALKILPATTRRNRRWPDANVNVNVWKISWIIFIGVQNYNFVYRKQMPRLVLLIIKKSSCFKYIKKCCLRYTRTTSMFRI